MARPRWNPTRPKNEKDWRAATGLLNRVNACYETFKSVDRAAPKDLLDPDAILKAFLRIRGEELKAAGPEELGKWPEAGKSVGWAFARALSPPAPAGGAFRDGTEKISEPEKRRLQEAARRRAKGSETVFNLHEIGGAYIEGFRAAALHVAEYRRARRKRELGHLDPRGHAYVMAAAIETGHDYKRRGIEGVLPARPREVQAKAEAARKLFANAAARYRKGPTKL